MARTSLDDHYRGGRIDGSGGDDPPKPRRYPCFAAGCPMPGTIFLGAGVGGTGDAQGSCAWHYAVQPHDIPKVTRVLLDWQCVAYEVREARRAHTSSELASNPQGLADAFDAAWQRVQPLVPGWEDELRPGIARSSKGEALGHREDYRAWGQRLERFLGARVVESLSVNVRRTA